MIKIRDKSNNRYFIDAFAHAAFWRSVAEKIPLSQSVEACKKYFEGKEIYKKVENE